MRLARAAGNGGLAAGLGDLAGGAGHLRAPGHGRGDERAEFTAALQAQVKAAGGRRICRRVARAIHAAARPGGIAAEQDAALERAGFACHDWMTALAATAEVEARMAGVLDDLHLTCLVATIPGLSAVSAAAILAETGDPSRYDSPRTWVKHAGLAPRANESGTFRGQAKTSGRGRPGLRTRRLAGHLGRPAAQPGLVRPPRRPHQPRLQPAPRRAGPRRCRSRAAAPALRGHH